MSQITIFSSVDLESAVVAALDRAGITSFLRLAGATGNKFLPEGSVPRTLAWDAVMFVIPAADDKQLEAIAAELAEVAAGCDPEPCLRMMTTPSQAVL